MEFPALEVVGAIALKLFMMADPSTKKDKERKRKNRPSEKKELWLRGMTGILQLTSPQVCLIVSVLSSYTLKTGTPIEDGDSILKLLPYN